MTSHAASLLTIFGASGDLSQRMLLPSLYGLQSDGLLPERMRILGTARSALDDAGFRALVVIGPPLLQRLDEHQARHQGQQWQGRGQNAPQIEALVGWPAERAVGLHGQAVAHQALRHRTGLEGHLAGHAQTLADVKLR